MLICQSSSISTNWRLFLTNYFESLVPDELYIEPDQTAF